MTMELRLSFAFSYFFMLKPLYACTPFDHHVSLILGDNRTASNPRDISVPAHPGRVPYEWLTHLVFLSVAPSDAPSLSWHVR